MQPAIATWGEDFEVSYLAPIPVPDTLTLSGAVSLTGGMATRPRCTAPNPLGVPEEEPVAVGVEE